MTFSARALLECCLAARGNHARCRSPNTARRPCRATSYREIIVKRFIAFLSAVLTFATFSAGAAESSPDALVKNTADEVLSIIRTTKDKKAVRDLAEKKVLPHFDFRTM